MAWPLNNYWNTNFRASQPGWLRFRYELTTHGPFQARAAAVTGLEASHPVETHPVLAPVTSAEGSLIEVEDPDVLPMHVKGAEDGEGVIVRLQNMAEESRQTRVRLPDSEFESAFHTSTMEQNRQPLQIVEGAALIEIPARGCMTLRLLPRAGG